ncbi:hypothetical protein ASPZODRAFT_1954253 [Penicilliopsis zonata CBS 506.65]|uniref:F-box domain-containing protein n=1 Tax=Penicilliopsis zonata CBS 506.65 TaxID=1073090 RepID=A0A1L9SGF7_9EURO|nr:hypothetical protein ASPZODRAFT_1954253 [Penicilliopsis zonata CBS 506.65]OJJ46355.1 hypothetical protein ASPZODRAFT_1954253 [Penicilliopsis zonata CBS 506.65]
MTPVGVGVSHLPALVCTCHLGSILHIANSICPIFWICCKKKRSYVLSFHCNFLQLTVLSLLVHLLDGIAVMELEEIDANIMAANIVRSFAQLKTKEARRAAYEGVLRQLSSKEWREIKDISSKITLQTDIISLLPVELVALVTRHLSIVDVVILQRVSKQWKSILSSWDIRKSVLMGHQITIPKGITTLEEQEMFFHRCARRRIALQRGRPFSVATYPHTMIFDQLEVVDQDTKYEITDYSSGICVGAFDRSICLWNWLEGVVDVIHLENRQDIKAVRVTNKIFAAITSMGHCHVWDLETKAEIADIRLPSSAYNSFITNESALAIEINSDLIIWDRISCITRVTRIETPCDISSIRITPTGDSFSTIEIKDETTEHQKITFLFKHWIFDAASRSYIFLASHSLCISVDYDLDDFSPDWSSRFSNRSGQSPLIFFDKTDSEAVPVLIISHYTVGGDIASRMVQFAAEDDYDDTDIVPLASDIVMVYFEDDFPWAGDHRLLRTYQLDNENILSKDTRVVLSESNLPGQGPFHKPVLYGDEDFIVALSEHGWHIWCFNPDIQLPNHISTRQS